MPPSTINIRFTLKSDKVKATTPPAIAECVLPVDESIPGNIRAPRAAKGINFKNLFISGGSFISLSKTIGSIRGI